MLQDILWRFQHAQKETASLNLDELVMPRDSRPRANGLINIFTIRPESTAVVLHSERVVPAAPSERSATTPNRNSIADAHFTTKDHRWPVRVYGRPLIEKLECETLFVQNDDVLAKDLDRANRAYNGIQSSGFDILRRITHRRVPCVLPSAPIPSLSVDLTYCQ